MKETNLSFLDRKQKIQLSKGIFMQSFITHVNELSEQIEDTILSQKEKEKEITMTIQLA